MGDGVPVDGRIERADDGVLRGWAWRADGADEIRLAVSVDGVLLASGTADGAARELVEPAGAPPAREFELGLPDDLIETGERRIAVQVLPESVPLAADEAFTGTTPDGVWSTTSFAVDTAPPPVVGGVDGTAVEVPALASEPPHRLMALESVSDGAVSGWTRSKRTPRATVVVRVDGTEVGRGSADIPRPDLPRHFYGFRVPMPDDLGPGPHAISVSVGRSPVPVHAGDLRPLTAAAGSLAAADLRLRCLDEPADPRSPARALLGRDGWLFDTREDRRIRWDKPIKPHAAEAFVALVASWAASLRELEIPYVLAFLPARERLAREFLPPEAPAPRPGPLAQVLPLLAEAHPSLDLRPVLRRLSETAAATWRTDPDLSPRGALAVGRELTAAAAALEPGLPVLRSEPEFQVVRGARGRFAGAAKVELSPDGLRPLDPDDVPLEAYGETIDLPVPDALSAVRVRAGQHLARVARRSAVLRNSVSHDRPERALLLGADPAAALGPWLAEVYGRVTVVDALAVPAVEVELESPDVVFHVIDEADVRLLV